MPYKVFVAGEEALAADANSYLMSQTVPRFTNATQRTSQLTAPVLNQLSMRDDRPGVLERWNGTAWVNLANMFHSQVTAQVNITNASAASAQEIINPGSVAYDGAPVVLEFFAPAVSLPPQAGALLIVNLFDGASDLGYFAALGNPAAAQHIAPMFLRRVITPTVGNHNYKVAGWLGAGTGTGFFFAGAGAGAGAYGPIYLSATKVT